MVRSLHILVVDDEVGFARLLARSLRRLGHAPQVASHPSDALQMFRDGQFDAVITDIDMPVMDGVELAETLRGLQSDLPIAFCTGSEPDGRRSKRAALFGAVLPKLWREDDVRELLLTLLPKN